VAGIAGLALVALVLLDAFETIVLPRRMTRRWRITVAVVRVSWWLYRGAARSIESPRRRERVLSYYGPASLLLTITCWVAAMILGYTAALWAFAGDLGGHPHSFATAAYVAASMFFTLGFSDVIAHGTAGRALVVAAGGTGFASLALLVSYLPVLYQAFSRRETYISQLDARAGSPPSAGELLARNGRDDGLEELGPFLLAWEGWSADLLESLLSFPSLGYYRSHHDNQSWLAALTALLDTCSLVLVSGERRPHRQAKLTYAMCRHAAVDLARVYRAIPVYDGDRLDAEAFERLRSRLEEGGWHLPEEALDGLAKLRRGYEPYVIGLSRELLIPLPDWTATDGTQDSWRMTEVAVPLRSPRRRSRSGLKPENSRVGP
jgi:hypothetical protein